MKQWKLIIFTAHYIVVTLYAYPYDYDLVIIGNGEVAVQAALLASAKDKHVALIHTNESCTKNAHFGNIRHKILIEIASLLNTVNRCQGAGLPINCPITVQPTNIMEYIEVMYQKICSMYSPGMLAQHNVTTLTGPISFIDPHTLCIQGMSITTEYVLLALEGYTSTPHIKGIDKVSFSTPENFFEGKLPRSIAILCEDPIGIEVAFALNALGVEVFLIEWYGILLPRADYEINNILYRFMLKNTMQVYLSANSLFLQPDQNNGVVITFKDRHNKTKTITADCLFIATPPACSFEGLALDNAYIKTTQNGILVNTTMQTTSPSIYACGNITYEAPFRCPYSLSLYQAQIAIHNMFKSFWSCTMHADYSKAEESIQTMPPLAWAGLTEQEAYKKYGKSIQVKYYSYNQLIRAHIDNATEGIAKFICDSKGTMLGVHILGNGAQELVALVPLGEKLKDLYSSYLEKTSSTSPSYLDLLWQASYTEQKAIPSLLN